MIIITNGVIEKIGVKELRKEICISVDKFENNIKEQDVIAKKIDRLKEEHSAKQQENIDILRYMRTLEESLYSKMSSE